MLSRSRSLRALVGPLVLVSALTFASPASAQPPGALDDLRVQYDAMMANFDRVLEAQGDAAGRDEVRRGRAAMRSLTDAQLQAVYSKTRVPDLSVVVTASSYMATAARSAKRSSSLAPTIGPSTPGLPGPVDPPSGCDGVDIAAETRYTQLIAKEVTNSILAAAAWVCNEDILGENGSLACVPLAIAADVANGFFDTSAFCAGEVTANQVDANFNRLQHIHDDLAGGISTIVNNSNANTATIVSNANANTNTIVTNDNANRTAIITNDNANTATIIANATANKNELRDLILRSQIEADLAMVDGAVVVALYELPNANGGYLDLVTTIVTETIARVRAAGGSVSNAATFLANANAAKAAGDFKSAYAFYRKAYKAAGN